MSVNVTGETNEELPNFNISFQGLAVLQTNESDEIELKESRCENLEASLKQKMFRAENPTAIYVIKQLVHGFSCVFIELWVLLRDD